MHSYEALRASAADYCMVDSIPRPSNPNPDNAESLGTHVI